MGERKRVVVGLGVGDEAPGGARAQGLSFWEGEERSKTKRWGCRGQDGAAKAPPPRALGEKKGGMVVAWRGRGMMRGKKCRRLGLMCRSRSRGCLSLSVPPAACVPGGGGQEDLSVSLSFTRHRSAVVRGRRPRRGRRKQQLVGDEGGDRGDDREARRFDRRLAAADGVRGDAQSADARGHPVVALWWLGWW